MRRMVWLGVLLMWCISVQGQVPRVISYQGLLLGTQGQPVPEGTYAITFRVYDHGGSCLWTEVHNQVMVSGGLFCVLLGTITPLTIPFDKPYQLGIQVGPDPEMIPRMEMTSAAYSMRAAQAESLRGIPVSTTPQPNTLLPLDGSGKFPPSVLPAATSGSYLKKNEPDTTSGSSAAEMLRIINTGAGRGVTVISKGAHGVFGKTSSDQAGTEGQNDGTGVGVRGGSLANHGVSGSTESASMAGIFGTTTDGIGVWGNSVAGHGVYGHSNAGRGVKGSSPAGGVYGESSTGLGVEGRSTGNDGVVGWTGKSGNSGVYGYSDAGAGITGRSSASDGIAGVTTSAAPGNAGVRARNEGGGPAIFCEGDLYVTGAIRGNIGSGGGGALSRPAFNSGWLPLGKAPNGNCDTLVIQHNLGGSNEDYLVCLDQDGGGGAKINQTRFFWWYGEYTGNHYSTGAYWYGLTPTTIYVTGAQYFPDKIRIRIWVCK